MNIAHALSARSEESGLPEALLKTVYLRGVRSPGGCPADALKRVDGFIIYALVRDTLYSKDRDLVAFL